MSGGRINIIHEILDKMKCDEIFQALFPADRGIRLSANSNHLLKG